VISLHGLFWLELNNLDYVDELIELLGYLLQSVAFDLNHHSDSRQAFNFAGSYREGFNIETSSCEKTSYAGK
jgi:hypothetical protein